MLLAQRLSLLQTSGEGVVAEGATTESAVAGGPRTTFVLATTHLKAGVSSQYENVRAKQATTLLSALDRFCASESESAGGAAEAVVLAGDLNADRQACSRLPTPDPLRAHIFSPVGQHAFIRLTTPR